MSKKMLMLSLLVGSLAIFPGTSHGARIIYSWPSNAGPINPHGYNPNQMYAQSMVYDPLVSYGEDGGIHPALAKSWEISEDGKTYTFHLREDVKFSDGTPLDAKAVEMNFEAVMRNAERHNWMDIVNQLDSWKAVDDHTFVLTLKNPYYPTLAELSLIRPFRIMAPSGFPDDLDTAKGIKAPIGTGPWMLVESKKGEYDLFKANPHWWGGTSEVQEVLVKVISDPTARAMAFDTGEIDLIYGANNGQIDMDTFKRYQSNRKVTSTVSGPMAGRSVALNSGKAPTDDLAVRKAILHGVNKKAIVDHVFLGLEHPADTLFSPESPYCDLGLEPYGFDPKVAGELLDQAGWTLKPGSPFRERDGKTLLVEFCFVGTDALQKAAAEAIQGDLRKIGMDVRLVAEEADSYYKRQKSGEFGMIFSSTWGAPYDPQSYCSSMRVPSHADYQAQIGLPMKEELDRQITEVMVTVGEERIQDLYRSILTTIHDQAVYLPLSYPTNITVHGDKIEEIPFMPMDYVIPFERIKLGR